MTENNEEKYFPYIASETMRLRYIPGFGYRFFPLTNNPTRKDKAFFNRLEKRRKANRKAKAARAHQRRTKKGK